MDARKAIGAPGAFTFYAADYFCTFRICSNKIVKLKTFREMSIRSIIPLLIFLPFDLLSQEPVVIETEYFKDISFAESYSPYKTEYSVIKRSGEIKKSINLKFHSIFNDGIAIAQDKSSKLFCYVDENLNKLIEFPNNVIHLTNFSEGVAWIKEKTKNPKLINLKNEKIFYCVGCEQVKNFSEGLSAFKNNDGQWGFIDKSGNIKFMLSKDVFYVSNFSEGLAQIFIRDPDYPESIFQFGYINKEGDIEIEPIYSLHEDDDLEVINGLKDDEFKFKNGYAKVAKNRIINKKGIVVIDSIYEDVKILNQGFLIGKRPDENKGKWRNEYFYTSFSHLDTTMIDQKDKVINTADQDLLIPRLRNGRYGFVNTDNKFLIQPIYSNADLFVHNYSEVSDSKGRNFLINKSGKIIFSFPGNESPGKYLKPYIHSTVFLVPWIDFYEGGGLQLKNVLINNWNATMF